MAAWSYFPCKPIRLSTHDKGEYGCQIFTCNFTMFTKCLMMPNMLYVLDKQHRWNFSPRGPTVQTITKTITGLSLSQLCFGNLLGRWVRPPLNCQHLDIRAHLQSLWLHDVLQLFPRFCAKVMNFWVKCDQDADDCELQPGRSEE